MMKKMMLLIVLTVGINLVAFGHGWGGFSNPEFNSLREIMQYGNHEAKKLDNGISVSLFSNNQDLATKIKELFTTDPEELGKYFGNITVKISEVATGVEITLTSDDKKVVDELHYFGPMLVYGYLRDRTFEKVNGNFSQGGFSGYRGYGPGGRRFFGHRGYGPGRGPWFGSGYWPGRAAGD